MVSFGQYVLRGLFVLAIVFSCACAQCFETEIAAAATHVATPSSSPTQPSHDSGPSARRGHIVVPDNEEAAGGEEGGIGSVLTVILGGLIVVGCAWYLLKIIGNILLVVVGWISRFLSFDD